MSEDQESCIFCSAVDLHRVPQMPFLKRSVEPKGSKVGDEVNAAIEANRELLKEAKNKAKGNYYDD